MSQIKVPPQEEKNQKIREKYGQSSEQVQRENAETYQSLDEAVEEADLNADELGARTPSSRSGKDLLQVDQNDGRRREDDELENPDFDKRQSRHEDDRELESSESSPRPIRSSSVVF